MDYSQLSDAEIAQKVWFWWNQNIEHDNTLCGMSGGKMLYVKNSVWTAFDPCHNPADAWPIIVDNRIAVIPDTAPGEWVAFNEFTLYEGDWMFASDPTHHSIGKNPLRCAMETFIMMQDANNV